MLICNIQMFISFINFYQYFIKSLSQILALITPILETFTKTFLGNQIHPQKVDLNSFSRDIINTDNASSIENKQIL